MQIIENVFGKRFYVRNVQDAYNLGWHQALCVKAPCQSCGITRGNDEEEVAETT